MTISPSYHWRQVRVVTGLICFYQRVKAHRIQSDTVIVRQVHQLRLVIKESTDYIFSWITHRHYPAKRFIIEAYGGERFVNSKKPFKGGITSIVAQQLELYIHPKNESPRKINLSDPMQEQLLDFVIHGPPSDIFRCYDFAAKLSGDYVIGQTTCFSSEEWLFSFIKEDRPAMVGELLLFGIGKTRKRSMYPVHAGIALGEDLCLSLGGNHGDLLVMGVTHLMNAYNCNVVLALKKRSEIKERLS